MSWREEQEQFWQWITRPQDLQQQSEAIDALFAAHRQLERSAALNIYNNAYHQRLIGIARELYPLLYRTLGDAPWQALWLAYLQAHPPRPGAMARLSENLLDFLHADPQYSRLPALLDIAELETRFIELFDRADEAPCSLSDLQALPEQDWPGMRWQPKQDWALISSRFDLQDYWQRMQDFFSDDSVPAGSAPFGPTPLPEPVNYLIRRHQMQMHFQPLTATMAGFLRGIQQGLNFAQLCDQLAETHPEEQVPALSLQLLLQAIDWELLSQRAQ